MMLATPISTLRLALVVLLLAAPDAGAAEEGAAEAVTVAAVTKAYVPGEGFDVASGEQGSLNISAYVLLRYINQLPAKQSFVDHLGRERDIDTRNDFQLHRVLIHFKGFLFEEKFTHDTAVWAVNSTNSITVISSLNYRYHKGLTLSGGIGALPGTRSMNYEHPFFLGTDRQMADEFFRPSFTSGLWVSGEPISRLFYRAMIGNNLNMVDISAAQITRDMAYGAMLAWMPTTGEFGPRGGYGDFEAHQQLATRFGVSGAHSREDRLSEVLNTTFPDNTSMRLSDSLNLFENSALAPGSTVQRADYNLVSADASMKWRGFFLFTEVYRRHLTNFVVEGPAVPQDTIDDTGLMIQVAQMVAPKRVEVYAAHSYIWGEFNRAWELTGGTNFYPYRSRSLKLNASLTYVDRSPVSSLFGYFVGGQKGPTIAASTDFTF